MVFPYVDGAQLNAGPCYVDTGGWRGSPSIMKHPHMRCNERTCAVHQTTAKQELLFRISHPAPMSVNGSDLHRVAHCWYFTSWTSCLFLLVLYSRTQFFNLGSSSKFVPTLTSMSFLSSCEFVSSSTCWRNDKKKHYLLNELTLILILRCWAL